jgi:RimJ/RimL family protein N-acetyltransferase
MGEGMVHFYRLGTPAGDDGALADLRARQPSHAASFWHPSATRPFTPGGFDPKLASYTFMQLAGMFHGPGYGAVLIARPGVELDHRSMVMPRFARFPFMAKDDLQIGATFTRPEARGQGLALRGVLEIVKHFAQPGRSFWYLTEASNPASIAVIRKAGFELAGTGQKHPRFGLRFLGFYDIGAVERTQPSDV